MARFRFKSITAEGKEKRWLARAEREGRGIGTGRDYVPFHQVRRHDINSIGRSALQQNPFLGRQQHLLSDLERSVAVLLIWAGVLDIREQYPLRVSGCEPEFNDFAARIEGTAQIASRLGIKHPMEPSRTEYRRLSTDFLVTHRDHTYLAVYVKPAKTLERGRSGRLGKLLSIEQEYWRQRNIKLIEITEKDVCVSAD